MLLLIHLKTVGIVFTETAIISMVNDDLCFGVAFLRVKLNSAKSFPLQKKDQQVVIYIVLTFNIV